MVNPWRKVSPQQVFFSPCPMLNTYRPVSLLHNYLVPIVLHIIFIWCKKPICAILWTLGIIFIYIFNFLQWKFPLLGYLYPYVQLWASNITTYNNEPVDSLWYSIKFFSQGLTIIYLSLNLLIPCDVLKKWGLYTSTYTWRVPRLNQATRVFKTSQFIQVIRFIRG